MAILIIRDGWVLEKQFEDNEKQQAEEYIDYLSRVYTGHFYVIKSVPDKVFAKGLKSYCKAIGF